MPNIGQIQVGGQTYNIVIPSGLTEEEKAQIRENIGAISQDDADVVRNGTYPEMTVGTAAKALQADSATTADKSSTSGYATSAGSATNDGNGNNIADTYLTLKEWLDTEYPAGGSRPYIQFPGEPTPAEKYAGTTWTIDTSYQGRTIIGSGGDYAFGSTGGSADAVVVNHTHSWEALYVGSGGVTADGATIQSGYVGTGKDLVSYSNGDYLYNYRIKSAGESGANKNLPPYTVVNYWKRTA